MQFLSKSYWKMRSPEPNFLAGRVFKAESMGLQAASPVWPVRDWKSRILGCSPTYLSSPRNLIQKVRGPEGTGVTFFHRCSSIPWSLWTGCSPSDLTQWPTLKRIPTTSFVFEHLICAWCHLSRFLESKQVKTDTRHSIRHCYGLSVYPNRPVLETYFLSAALFEDGAPWEVFWAWGTHLINGLMSYRNWFPFSLSCMHSLCAVN